MANTRKDTKNRYDTAVEDYVILFKNTYFRNVECEDWWVSKEIGTVLAINDYFFPFTDIKYAIDNKVARNELFAWYDHSLEHGANNCEGEPPTLREWWENRKNRQKLATWQLGLYNRVVMDFTKDPKIVQGDPTEHGWYATVLVGPGGIATSANRWTGKWEQPVAVGYQIVARTAEPLNVAM